MNEPAAVREIYARPLTTVTMRSIEWLEKPLWQRSAFQLLAGPKGSGKGTYLAALASRITNAGQNALFVSTEDSAEIDLKPRLVAAGANIERCFDITQHIDLPFDIGALQQLGESMQPLGLFIIDPVANHIGDRDSNAEAAIREAIAPLNALANQLDCLLIGVRHPGKNRERGALASVLGSTAWVDVPRAVVFIAKDDQDPLIRHIQVVAGNRALNGKAQHFRIEPAEVEGLTEPITKCIDLGESQKDVDELLMMKIKEPSKTDKAKALLLDILEERGEQNSDKLDAEVAKTVGLATLTIRNIRTELKNEGLVGIRPVKDEETAMVDHWIVFRTLELREGHHYASPPHDPENEVVTFVEQAKKPESGNGLTDKDHDSRSDSRDVDSDSPDHDLYKLQRVSGSTTINPDHDPLLNSDVSFVKQAKNGSRDLNGKTTGKVHLTTPAEYARDNPQTELVPLAQLADPPEAEPGYDPHDW